MVEGIWKSKARAREEDSQWKQVKDLWKWRARDWRITGGQAKSKAVVELTDGQAQDEVMCEVITGYRVYRL